MKTEQAKDATDNHRTVEISGPIAVLLGGTSAERDISLQSGAAILQALLAQSIDARAIDTGDKDWQQCLAKDFKHSFIALHGGDGEDGTIQALLETMGISYTGSGVEASALAMDKIKCKQLWQTQGLPTPRFVELTDNSDWTAIIAQLGKVFVKPVAAGSSIGMGVAESAAELEAAYQKAKVYDPQVMAEQLVEGAEFTVAILGDQALPPIRLETDSLFYDYEAKYISDDTRYICPCGLSPEQELQLQKIALSAFASVGCSSWGRVDLMQDGQGDFYLLEVNTVPGMTSHSLVPMAAKAIDMSFETLVLDILKRSLAAPGLES